MQQTYNELLGSQVVMSLAPQHFYDRAKSFVSNESDLPEFFAYFLTIERGAPTATVKAVRECYEVCDLSPPSWLASHFSNGLKRKPKRFIKQGGGYRLENARRERILRLLEQDVAHRRTSSALNGLEVQIKDGPKRDFLHETINCLSASAYRAAVVMGWNLAIHHLHDYVLSEPAIHASFNLALANNTDSRVRIKTVSKPDDFTEMSEGKFLLFCREAKIITSSLFNKLEARLHERNSAAHPSGVKTTPKVAEAYIEDLVENVLKKFLV